MTRTEALHIVSRESPCPHNNPTFSLENGKILGRCVDCGGTFEQIRLIEAREALKLFEAAVELLSESPTEEKLKAYAGELKVASLTVDELIASHRRVVEELNATSRPAHKAMMQKAYKAAEKHFRGQVGISFSNLRRMSLAKIAELIG